MGRLTNLFSFTPFAANATHDVIVDAGSDKREIAADGTADQSVFRFLGESQKAIERDLALVGEGLKTIGALAGSTATLRLEIIEAYDRHRRLAALSSNLGFDLSQVRDALQEKTAQFDALQTQFLNEQGKLKLANEDVQKFSAELEILRQNHHLVTVGKREAEENFARAANQLALLQGELHGLNLELGAAKLQVDSDADRIRDLSAALLEANQSKALLGKHCEVLEASQDVNNHEIAALREANETLLRDSIEANQCASQKEQESAQLRSEMTRLVEKQQSELRVRDRDLNQARSDVDMLRARVGMLEQVNLETKTENEKVLSEIRALRESNKHFEVVVGTLEGKLARANANLDALTETKTQIDQSRLAVVSRLDATAQALRSRDIDVKRLENEIAHQAMLLEEQGAQHRDVVAHLSNMITQLEKELFSRNNEIEFLNSKS